MVVIDIDIIHGDHLVVEPSNQLDLIDWPSLPPTLFETLAKANPEAQSISLNLLRSQLMYHVDNPNKTTLYDAKSGLTVADLTVEEAHQQAQQYYAGDAEISSATLIEANPPSEIGSRALPLWRIDFDDIWGSSLYISPQTGELVSKRHTLWRVFDFAWMLHIMDYDERENVNNGILRITSSLALLLVFSGVWYLYFRLNLGRIWRRKAQ
ncbi:hypothetical protein DFR28_10288 [Arenicella xantha]|uniref:PepSY-associated transmembrane protein n=2 Tax=Arenicella xantha TaxID=644221 RepID=A0A395JLF1_9GAMM|nr:hypothetical protein DFR28_10288 [Arenicella xantha]